MTKQDFLDELKNALEGEVTPEVMMDSYQYYSRFIDEEMRKGRKEDEILEELGRPNLIARSIIAAKTGERVADVEYTEDGRTRKIKRKSVSDKYSFEKTESAAREKTYKKFVFDFNAWYAKVLYAVIFILLVFVMYFVIKVGFWVLVTFGIPIMILLGIIYLIMYFLK